MTELRFTSDVWRIWMFLLLIAGALLIVIATLVGWVLLALLGDLWTVVAIVGALCELTFLAAFVGALGSES